MKTCTPLKILRVLPDPFGNVDKMAALRQDKKGGRRLRAWREYAFKPGRLKTVLSVR